MLTPDPFSLDKSAVSYVLAYAYVCMLGLLSVFTGLIRAVMLALMLMSGPFSRKPCYGSACIVSSEKSGLLQTLLYISWTELNELRSCEVWHLNQFTWLGHFSCLVYV